MRAVGVSMVRNEADVIEAFVRHNLRVLDALHVVDHGSFDGTGEVLVALAREGLPLTVTHDPSLAQRQAEVLSAAAHAAFAAGADIVFPLDADEFLRIPDRPLAERVIAGVPAGLNAALHWRTHIVDFDAAPPAHPLAAVRTRLAAERHGLHKVVLTRAFAEAPAAMLGPGSHTVWQDCARAPPSADARIARVAPAVAALAHVPVRSAGQLSGKVTQGWLAHRAARPANPELAFHWRELHDEIRRDGPPSQARLLDIAVNYGLPQAQWRPARDVERVYDPLALDVELRYGALVRRDTAQIAREFAERLARAIAT
ncbi:MAG: glycosyltransferase family 2 protein [Betaproteobacteria bacterium]